MEVPRMFLTLGMPCRLETRGKGYLVFNDLGAAAHPFGEDNDLVFGQVRMASMGFWPDGEDTPCEQP